MKKKKTKKEIKIVSNNSHPTKQDLSKLPHKLQVMFATFCAEQVFHLVKEQDKPVCRVAIDTAKSWVFGEGATVEDCKKAANAAANAAYAAYAANATAHAVYAAYAAAHAANAAYAAAHATANAAYAAAHAANAAHAADAATYAAANAAYVATDKKKTIEEQWNYYHELLSMDETVEKNLIG